MCGVEGGVLIPRMIIGGAPLNNSDGEKMGTGGKERLVCCPGFGLRRGTREPAMAPRMRPWPGLGAIRFAERIEGEGPASLCFRAIIIPCGLILPLLGDARVIILLGTFF
uniref:Uncharacterized protein n=1 Tax=Odontella aurita TaxID=265563 RepID=A0A7S4J476_9STRA